MSGTSLDGVDGVVVRRGGGTDFAVLAHRHEAFAGTVAAELLALNTPGPQELHRAALAGNALALVYANVTEALLAATGLERAAIRAIGAHGQTVRHRPAAFDGIGYTVQLLNGALLAERCGIDVACDFRSRDVAAGGQGAPLVPAFHQVRFGRASVATAVLNLGGMSNLTLIDASGATTGFDCGPGNVLLDAWMQRTRGAAFDADGAFAASGRVIDALLVVLRSDPFFALPPPKSTGRDQFNVGWLDAALQRSGVGPPTPPQDVQTTLAELSAGIVVDALTRHAAGTRELIVCGGGAYNVHLLARIAALRPGLAVVRSDDRGLPATQVEACAFAWLAQALVERRPGNVPAVTGARGPRVLGALHPAR